MSGDFTAADDPAALFDVWFAEAQAAEVNDPHAMALATVDEDGLPDVRMVLMNGGDVLGPLFYTHSTGGKGRQLAANPRAALLFHWKSLRRQVRLRGPVAMLTAEESDRYFMSRPRESRIGAWASRQSETLESRAAFEAELAALTERFAGQEVTRPPHWTGYRLTPLSIEFWQDRPFRLHDRLVFRRATPTAPFEKTRLYP